MLDCLRFSNAYLPGAAQRDMNSCQPLSVTGIPILGIYPEQRRSARPDLTGATFTTGHTLLGISSILYTTIPPYRQPMQKAIRSIRIHPIKKSIRSFGHTAYE